MLLSSIHESLHKSYKAGNKTIEWFTPRFMKTSDSISSFLRREMLAVLVEVSIAKINITIC
jgi:hypothetical protein